MLIQGCDVWMNTPTRPLEASGTSGEKGVMNGTLHFSVLDGWWVEGYRKDAGWSLPIERTFDIDELQDELDAETIYSLLENEIIPAFYYRNEKNIPILWVDYIKNNFAEVVPNFTTRRMMKDYFDRYYIPLTKRSKSLRENDFAEAKDIAAWKDKILGVWDDIEVVSVQMADGITNTYRIGQSYPSKLILDIKGLSPDEIGVEIVIASGNEHSEFVGRYEFIPEKVENDLTHYKLDLTLTKPGSYNYGIRIFPKNSALPNRQDFKILKWL